MSGRSLQDLMRSDRVLGTLAKEAAHLAELDALWQRLLPHAIRGQSRIAALREGRLLVFADQAAVATRLRMLESGLRVRLEEAGWPVAQIRIKIGRSLEKAPRENHLFIGEQGLEALEAGADTLHDEGLKKALYRLVRHQRSRNG